MRQIRIVFADGTERTWQHEGRAGGSYTKTVSLESGWVVIRDEWGNTYSYPGSTVKAVETKE